MRLFTQSVPRVALRIHVIRAYHRGLHICHSYCTQSIRSVADSAKSQKQGLSRFVQSRHLVQLSRLLGAVPQGVPHVFCERLSDRQLRAALNLAARRDLDLFVCLRGS
jgi:hypothetical protein